MKEREKYKERERERERDKERERERGRERERREYMKKLTYSGCLSFQLGVIQSVDRGVAGNIMKDSKDISIAM